MNNYEYVGKGFGSLLDVTARFVCKEVRNVYKNRWWDQILSSLNTPWDLPVDGEFNELMNSLDIACCLKIIDRMWNDVFRNMLSPDCRSYAKELIGVRNVYSHKGRQDLDQPMSERALQTMFLLCKEMEPTKAGDIQDLYQEVRGKADKTIIRYREINTGYIDQPESASKRGELQEGSLLKQEGTEYVQKTKLVRKVTYGGKTVEYPVFRVRLDALYYNDQNDRIATWITQYESENGKDSLQELNTDIYNRIIEDFIYDSNPDSIERTQKNIKAVGQREPGVTLADGRVVDGNRRFTCLRRLERESSEPLYFETVIIDVDIHVDKKQIKLLELSIQHGEEKKVEYDLIDFAVGTYRDITQTGLITIEEYAASTNEAVATVKKRLDVAKVISEFLDYIKVPGQYHIARELQIYSLFDESIPVLRKLSPEDENRLKITIFNNIMLKAIKDQRKFIRDIKSMINNDVYEAYINEQDELNTVISDKLANCEFRTKEDVDRFASENSKLSSDVENIMENALLRYRSKQLKDKPLENLSKCVTLLMEVDPRYFDKLEPEEKERLTANLEDISSIVENFKSFFNK